MTLGSFLSTLRTNNVQVTVNDLQDKLVCKIDAASYAALDDAVESRTISRWTLNGATALSVVINDAEQTTNNQTNDNSGSSNQTTDTTNTDPSNTDPSSDPSSDPTGDP